MVATLEGGTLALAGSTVDEILSEARTRAGAAALTLDSHLLSTCD